MLIDARHPEETRVAVLKGNRIEEFDFESADHKQIKGNIYLAKVTRVEPSLQAAFVDFGGNRHGFLAFSEIHPDYYQIPKEDREALLAEEAAHAEEEAALRAAEDEDEDDSGYHEDDDHDTLSEDFDGDGIEEIDTSEKDDVATIEDGHVDADAHEDEGGEHGADDESEDADDDRSRGRGRRRGRRQGGGRGGQSRAKEADELRAKRLALRRRYKIQDVIQRRQVLLVQVVKEERGNKGAALTTYLSLAGRYTVLMPNSSHGGGISRKISSAADRKRLKSIVSDLQLPRSMGLIVRTAGLQRTKTEIKRDFDYLARLWDGIRENTLKSSAPAMIHSDSDLIKRAIRDIYDKEIEEVVVEGDEGYKSARAFMKLLMPSHAKRVVQYSDPVPLFQRYGAEDQLSAMYDPMVQLKSGGYLVINPTEALVSIDINSGRSTKEHGIEQTALNTNLEAAREIARQLRLRDMAGLVVIDFIDMEYGSNVRKVEKAMKDALKHDRARIQVGRISGFGLMEMSRQRLRTGVLEATTRQCPHCDGTGLVRTASSAGLSALRLIEDEAAKGRGTIISLFASTEAAVYLLNAKRADLAAIENLYGVHVEVLPEGEEEGAKMRVQSSGPRPAEAPRFEPIVHAHEENEELEQEDEDEEDERHAERDDDERGSHRKRRRRRGGKGRKRREDGEEGEREAHDDDHKKDEEAPSEGDQEREHADEEDRPRKRRRRGGRRRRRHDEEGQAGEEAVDETLDEGASELDEVAKQLDDDIAIVAEPEPAEEEKPKKRASRRTKKAAPSEAEEAEAPAEAPPAEVAEEAKPKRGRRKKPALSEVEGAEAAPASKEAPQEAVDAVEAKPKRSRRKKADVGEAEGAEETAAKPASSRSKATPAPAPEPAAANDANGGEPAPAEPRRGGWWQRTFGE
jgi:ribonuclease E